MEERASGIAAAWQHRRWRRLLGSYTLAMSGDLMYLVAITVYVIQRTDSTAWIAVATISRIVGNVVLGPIAGAVADRYDRRAVLVVSNLAAAALMVVTALVVWAEGPVGLAVALTTLGSVATLTIAPAAVALTPSLVPEDDLAAASAAQSAIGQVATFLGPAFGAVVVAHGNAGLAYAVNGVVFVAAGALAVGVSAGEGSGASEPGAALSIRVLAAEVADGARFIRRDPALVALFALTFVLLFQVGVTDVVQVLIAEQHLHLGASGVGVLAAATGVGGLLITPLTPRLGVARSSGAVLAASGLVIGLPMMVIAVARASVAAIVFTAVVGIGSILFEVLYITMLQRLSPPEALARIFGFNDTVAAAGQLLGASAAPFLVHTFDLRTTLLLTGAVVAVTALLLGPALHRSAVVADDERRRLAPAVARLRPLAIFDGASQAALERLARASREVTAVAGTVVIREGAPADDLYVVVSGTFDVTTAAAGVIDRLEDGDWFGEVGLLHRMPRTATVTATGPVELLAIDGGAFLDAVSAPELLPDGLRRTIASRLRRAGQSPTTASA